MSAVLVLCGIFIGSGLTLMALKRRVDEFRSRPDLLSQRMLDRMKTDLELTDSQSEEIRKIFTEARREAGQMRERNRAQTQAFFREFQGDVAQVLTPSQQSEWEEWFRRARSRAMKDRHEGSKDDKSDDGPDKRDDKPQRLRMDDGVSPVNPADPRPAPPNFGDEPPRLPELRRGPDDAPPPPK
jgi:hypothetical protein